MTKTEKIDLTTKPLRVSEWWGSKFAPIFGIVYATCLLFQIPFFNLFTFFLFLLVALLPGASFVSLINDLTDLEEDKIAGKKNRLEGKSKKYALTLIFICLLIGVIVSFFLSRVSLFLYLAAWIVFSLYSLPPIRLKKRGIWGVIADTLGANVFPQMFAVAVLAEWFGKDFDYRWFFAVAIWAFLLGLRGIISHQLADKKNDEKANIKTFVQFFESSQIIKFCNWIIFPLEITALIFLLYFPANWWGFVFLGSYAIWATLVHFVWDMKLATVTQKTKELFLLSDFYFIFFPISFLLTGLTIFPYSWIVIILHLALFFKNFSKFLVEIFRLKSDVWLIIREFLFGY